MKNQRSGVEGGRRRGSTGHCLRKKEDVKIEKAMGVAVGDVRFAVRVLLDRGDKGGRCR